MSVKPSKLSVVEVLANQEEIRKVIENLRSVAQRRWIAETALDLKVDTGFSEGICKVAAKHSRTSRTAIRRACQIADLLVELQQS